MEMPTKWMVFHGADSETPENGNDTPFPLRLGIGLFGVRRCPFHFPPQRSICGVPSERVDVSGVVPRVCTLGWYASPRWGA